MRTQRTGLWTQWRKASVGQRESSMETCTLKVAVLVTQSCPTLWDPMDYSQSGSSVHGIFQAKVLAWQPFAFPGDRPNPGTEPRSPALQADPLPSEPPGNPKNTGAGSLSLLQRIFPTQESNLQHCRQILYQLSYLFGGFALNASTEALWVKCDFSRNLSISSRFFQISCIELCRATSYNFLNLLVF